MVRLILSARLIDNENTLLVLDWILDLRWKLGVPGDASRYILAPLSLLISIDSVDVVSSSIDFADPRSRREKKALEDRINEGDLWSPGDGDRRVLDSTRREESAGVLDPE